jgi:uncharacterized protein (TIGR03000 family)
MRRCISSWSLLVLAAASLFLTTMPNRAEAWNGPVYGTGGYAGYSPYFGYAYKYPYYGGVEVFSYYPPQWIFNYRYPYTYLTPQSTLNAPMGSTAAPSSYNSIAAKEPDNKAHLVVRVPDVNAEVSVNGTKTTMTGEVRYFQSPKLEVGQYTYELTATWVDKGKTYTQTKSVKFGPNSQTTVEFKQEPALSMTW